MNDHLEPLALANRSLAHSRRETIWRLSCAIEARSGETGEHSNRMSVMCGLLAERMGVDPEHSELIGVASALHDVGKLAIPDAILNKPGPLTASERAVVEAHARIGHRMLAGSNEPLLDLGALMALTHHEWVDGSGYPDGLVGDDIPLEGRIAAVADVFDALTNDRSYRPAFGVVEAMTIMEQGRGTQFDARVFDSLRDDLEHILAVVERAPAAVAPEVEVPARPRLQREMDDRAETTADQIAANLDQGAADSDRAGSAVDQASSDADQAMADQEQRAADRDQALADRQHLQNGGTAFALHAYEVSRAERDASTHVRESTAAERLRTTAERLAGAARRDEIARVRDLTAAIRDRTADARDEAADARDRAAEQRERQAAAAGDLYDVANPLTELRTFGASVRRRAAAERAAAAADRAAAAADRDRAALDRRLANVDELTGLFRRGPGELALTHEIDRSRRLGRSLVVGILDVDGLKEVNDTQGHAAGDAVLRDVPTAILSTLRSYDVAVRWGGDEFVCALSDVTVEVADQRFGDIQDAFRALCPESSISVGVAELGDDDCLETLIARADAALYRAKARRDGRDIAFLNPPEHVESDRR